MAAALSSIGMAAHAADTIKVGILHSLSGTMAISETALKETALMTIAEINKIGGVLGKKLEPVVVDPASNWPLFAEKARQLLAKDKVAVVFGCWTSVSRKSVLPVFKELNGLLFYPVQYEGEELEKNVFYTGAAPNQQAIPAVEYLMSKDGGEAKRFVLLGTDYVYPRTTNKILRAFLKSKGVAEADIMEEYTPFGHSDYQTIIAKIKKFAAEGKKTAVVSTINGDSNVPFYKELGNAGLKATDVPVVAFSVGEEELRGVDTKPLVGHLAAWNYFMSLKNPQNEKFVKMYKDWAKRQKLPNAGTVVTNDPMEATYVGIHMWKQAVEKAKCNRCQQGHPGRRRPELRRTLRLHPQDGRNQPSPVEAGVHRRDQGRRPVQCRLEDARDRFAPSRGARSSPATRKRRTPRKASNPGSPSVAQDGGFGPRFCQFFKKAQGIRMNREEVTDLIVTQKIKKKLTWAQLAEIVGHSKEWSTAALLGQMTLTEAQAKAVGAALDLPEEAVAQLQVVPYKGSLPSAVPTDPLIYRFYELVNVYGTTFKALIHEEFGDGIMSAIDFNMDLHPRARPQGRPRQDRHERQVPAVQDLLSSTLPAADLRRRALIPDETGFAGRVLKIGLF